MLSVIHCVGQLFISGQQAQEEESFLWAADVGHMDLYVFWMVFFYNPLKYSGKKTEGIFQLYKITILFLLDKLNREMQFNIIHRELFSAGSHVSGRNIRLNF